MHLFALVELELSPLQAPRLFCCSGNTKPLTDKDGVAVDVRVDCKEVSSQLELGHDSIARILRIGQA
ncbi:hypothetical protein ACFX13_014528 [Malus domestica]